MRIHFFNENFFETINTEEKAYWIGFIYADGHVNNYTVTIGLKDIDGEHLENLLKSIEAKNLKIEYVMRNDGYKMAKVTLCSAKTCKDLKEKGFTNNKTYDNDDYVFQCIPDDLKHHFIRGFWDGDGCVQLRQGKFGAINVVSLNEKLLQSFCDYFSQKFNTPNFAEVKLIEKYYRIIIGSEKAKKVCNLFYKDSTIYLERKYQNYLKFKTYNKNYTGIRKRKSGRYQAYIKVDYQQKSLGTYNTIKEAVEAYNKEAIKYRRQTQEYKGESLLRSEEDIV